MMNAAEKAVEALELLEAEIQPGARIEFFERLVGDAICHAREAAAEAKEDKEFSDAFGHMKFIVDINKANKRAHLLANSKGRSCKIREQYRKDCHA